MVFGLKSDSSAVESVSNDIVSQKSFLHFNNENFFAKNQKIWKNYKTCEERQIMKKKRFNQLEGGNYTSGSRPS